MGNLRTALLAWVGARGTGRRFVMRVEDIDAARSSHASGERQLEDLAALGLDWDELYWQSEAPTRHQQALERLLAGGHVFECYCSRREIREAASAPHVPPGFYPGTCLHLTEGERQTARERLAAAQHQVIDCAFHVPGIQVVHSPSFSPTQSQRRGAPRRGQPFPRGLPFALGKVQTSPWVESRRHVGR